MNKKYTFSVEKITSYLTKICDLIDKSAIIHKIGSEFKNTKGRNIARKGNYRIGRRKEKTAPLQPSRGRENRTQTLTQTQTQTQTQKTSSKEKENLYYGLWKKVFVKKWL